MTQALTTTNARPHLAAGNSVSAIVPRDAEQAFRMAQLIVSSGMAPSTLRSAEAVVIAIMHGLEIGLKPMQAVQSIAVVNGRPTIWGDAAIGLVQASGLAEYIVERIDGEGDAMVAVCETKRAHSPAVTVSRFSVEDARTAGLWGKAGPWKQYPRRMLQMRARAFALRDAYADVLKGLGIHEEMRDFAAPAQRPVRDLAAEIAAQAAAAPPESPQDEREPETEYDGATGEIVDPGASGGDEADGTPAEPETMAWTNTAGQTRNLPVDRVATMMDKLASDGAVDELRDRIRLNRAELERTMPAALRAWEAMA